LGDESFSTSYLPVSYLKIYEVKILRCRSIILPVVVYGCETWSHALNEEHGFTGFEKGYRREYLDLREAK
jgi:hypothetical protein